MVFALQLAAIAAWGPWQLFAVPSIPDGPSPAAKALQVKLDAALPGDVVVVPPGSLLFSNSSLLIRGAVRIPLACTWANQLRLLCLLRRSI